MNDLYVSYKKKVLIACSMIEDEINAVFDLFACDDIEIIWQDRGLHNDPEKLNYAVQDVISKAENDGADLIMLAFGLCGNGAVGWHTDRAVLAMPRFDDCCNMMLCTGKRRKRNLLEAGNMYLTKGWSKDEGALLSMLDRARERYGDRRGLKAMKLMFDSYKKVTVINTGCFELRPVEDYAEKCATLLDLEKCTVRGSNEILRKLITGEWDEDIIIKIPGEIITDSDFAFGEESVPKVSNIWFKDNDVFNKF